MTHAIAEPPAESVTVGHEPTLEARSLSKSYGNHHAVSELDLSVAPGDIYCLLGPNGAGKTTTINLFLGFVAPTSGEARVAGLDVAAHDLETKAHKYCCSELAGTFQTSVTMVKRWLAERPRDGAR